MKRRGSHFQMVQGKSGVPFIDARDESLIIPMRANGEVIFIVEPSAAFEEDVLLLPGGSVESGESAAETADRELQEETGYKAARLDYLGVVRPWSKYLRVSSHIYLGRELRESQATGDEEYVIQRVTVPLDDTPRLIAEGAIRDARVIVALQLVRAYLGEEPA